MDEKTPQLKNLKASSRLLLESRKARDRLGSALAALTQRKNQAKETANSTAGLVAVGAVFVVCAGLVFGLVKRLHSNFG